MNLTTIETVETRLLFTLATERNRSGFSVTLVFMISEKRERGTMASLEY